MSKKEIDRREAVMKQRFRIFSKSSGGQYRVSDGTFEILNIDADGVLIKKIAKGFDAVKCKHRIPLDDFKAFVKIERE